MRPRTIFSIVWFAAFLAVGAAWGQTVRYVDGDSGSDSNAGTADAPWRTLGHAAARTGNHTILYHAGTFNEPMVRINRRESFHLRRDPRVPGRSTLHGGALVTHWGEPEGVAYPVIGPIPDFLGPTTVTEDYRQDTDGSVTGIEGAYFGHLRKTWSVSECRALPASWFYDGPQRRLWIHTSDSSDPRTNRREYRWGRRGTAIRFANCVDSSASGFIGLHWCDFLGAGNGMTLYGLHCRACTFSDSEAFDHGWHAFGFGGSFSRDNALRRLRVTGGNWDDQGFLSGGITKAIPYVFAGTNAGGANPSNGGNVGEELAYIASPLMDAFGLPLADRNHLVGGYDSTGAIAAISHGGEGGPMNGVLWTLLDARAWSPNTELALVGAGDQDIPAQPASWNHFHVRVEQSTLVSARGFIASGIGVHGVAWSVIGADQDRVGVGCRVLDGDLWLESCTIAGASGARQGSALFRVSSGARLTMLGCTVYCAGPQDPSASLAVSIQDDATWSARQCIFLRDQPGPVAQAPASTGPDRIDVRHCWYSGIGEPFSIAPDGVGWSQSHWRDLIDPDGLYGPDPELVSPSTGDFSPRPGGAAASLSRFVPLHAERGINSFPYDGRYGAWQFGGQAPCAADFDRDGFLTGVDFDLFVEAFENGALDADFDLDGFVTGQDFDAYVGAFAEGC